MTGTIDCVYETPCGWCSKWDKKCDKKISEREQRAKYNPIDDDIENSLLKEISSCVLESDHIWERYWIPGIGKVYRCINCGTIIKRRV